MSLPSVVATKRRMKEHAKAHGIPVPDGFNAIVPTWGAGARRLAWRVSSDAAKAGWNIEPTADRNHALCRLLFPERLLLIKHDWSYRYTLIKRIGKPPGAVWHHAAAKTLSPADVQRIDLANGWSGFGYAFYVRKNGEVHQGRPEQYIGAHARGYNDWIGVCAEGAYHVETKMPPAQLAALKAVHAHLHRKYGNIRDRRHSDVNATACPGKYYPYGMVTR